jgi:hypothetical protein
VLSLVGELLSGDGAVHRIKYSFIFFFTYWFIYSFILDVKCVLLSS